MKTRILLVTTFLAIAAMLALLKVAAHQAATSAAEIHVSNDAAYRDGRYQAQLDLLQKRAAHITSGRWNMEQDRAAFVAGYVEAYHQDVHSSKLTPQDLAELTGYSEGMADGVRDRRTAQAYQVARSGRLVESTAVYGDVSAVYRRAYTNGYQLGYYAQSQTAQELGQATR